MTQLITWRALIFKLLLLRFLLFSLDDFGRFLSFLKKVFQTELLNLNLRWRLNFWKLRDLEFETVISFCNFLFKFDCNFFAIFFYRKRCNLTFSPVVDVFVPIFKFGVTILAAKPELFLMDILMVFQRVFSRK